MNQVRPENGGSRRRRRWIAVAAVVVIVIAIYGYVARRDAQCLRECETSGFTTGATVWTFGGALGVTLECGCGPYRGTPR